MGILRSETMAHGLMVIPAERARRVLNTLGHTAPIEFIDSADPKDLNLVRPYKKYVGRIDTVLKHTKQIIGDVEKLAPDTIVTGRVETFLDRDGERDMFQMDDLEAMIEKRQRQFAFFRRNKESIDAEIAMCLEERFVMELAVKVLGSPPKGAPVKKAEEASLLANEGGMKGDAEMSFSNVAGTCLASDVARIARQVFRATRGNTFTIHEDIDHDFWDAKAEKNVRKAVFSIYFQGGVSSAMSDKVLKICSAAGCVMYPWPSSKSQAVGRKRDIQTQIVDKEAALAAFTASMAAELESWKAVTVEGGNSQIEEIRMFLEKERAIYVNLNNFAGKGATISAQCWFPASAKEVIEEMLMKDGVGQATSGLLVPEGFGGESPPTLIRRTEFAAPFQELIDTYGIAQYKEANPAYFAMITFPFLFGIMYGDVFHGGCLFLFGIYLCLNADSLKYGDDNSKSLFFARYLVLMMGFFAVFAGFIYNDFLSLGVNLFESRYEWQHGVSGDISLKPKFDAMNAGGPGPYPFGLDPAWAGAENELLFVNSLKMKVSVLVGVVQMTGGVILRFSNAIYFRSAVDLCFECVPMMTFMICFFGYMDWMIVYKWVTPTSTCPSLINSMISMGLGQPDKDPLYEGQPEVQGWLMFFIMLSVPCLLIPKPLCIFIQHSVKGNKVAVEDEENGDAHGHGYGDEFDFAEIVIHQVIETIEYVLGTVSHTASYLRLWALSLAHQQLSLVFFQKSMYSALESGNPVYIYCGFAVLMAITAGVLLGMDVLECFLHTLRLHWVEFNSKFFHTGGRTFAPYSHEHTLAA